ncbi:unnamed protein product [Litomosoides sigmodontis]|uniref:Uncharacterized protein n=1 Tax=Litomosoides sigmodontis TaxID=42156 RepID=A0A3P6U620_LITSI|nr:unnamed protein product [Litomosoides sigmodontis]
MGPEVLAGNLFVTRWGEWVGGRVGQCGGCLCRELLTILNDAESKSCKLGNDVHAKRAVSSCNERIETGL